MYTCERDALKYIEQNKALLLSELEEMEMKEIYIDENVGIHIMKNGNKLLKFINKYSDNSVTDIFKEMIDSKLIG